MRKYVTVYTPKNPEIHQEIIDVIEAKDRDAGRDLAAVKSADLRLQGLKYYAPKVRLFKEEADKHLLPEPAEIENVTPIHTGFPAAKDDQLTICETVLGKVPKDDFQDQVDALNRQINRLWPGEVLRLEGVPERVYHAVIGVGSTALKHFVDCPAKYKAYIDGLLKFTRNYFDLGSAVHALVLEPELFKNFQPLPEEIKVRRGKAWDALQAENPGITYMNAEDYQKAMDMAWAVRLKYSELFTGGQSEVSFWKRDERTGIIIKGRADYEKGLLCTDLKTAASVKPSIFNKKSVDLGYYLQDALYTEIAGFEDFLFCAVESEAPYLCTLNAYSESEREIAYQEMREALDAMAICIEKDYWPGYSQDYAINEMTIPGWKKLQITGDYQ